MDRNSEQKPKSEESEEAIEAQAEESRKALDEIPPPGTDPLHEGP